MVLHEILLVRDYIRVLQSPQQFDLHQASLLLLSLQALKHDLLGNELLAGLPMLHENRGSKTAPANNLLFFIDATVF